MNVNRLFRRGNTAERKLSSIALSALDCKRFLGENPGLHRTMPQPPTRLPALASAVRKKDAGALPGDMRSSDSLLTSRERMTQIIFYLT